MENTNNTDMLNPAVDTKVNEGKITSLFDAVPEKVKRKSKSAESMIMSAATENNDAEAELKEKVDEARMERERQRTIAYMNAHKQVVREGKKIGRNDPCPCGSGKKYKNCCLESGKYEKFKRI